ncbi:polysaccharide deacetylase family protein [Candidatus Latescibacterota bacterium]
MKNNSLSRRTFLCKTSTIAAGAAAGTFAGHGCGSEKKLSAVNASNIHNYNPKKNGGCSVTFSYDVDMPCGGNTYLYDRLIPWLRGDDGHDAHGHLNDDVRNYIKNLATTAENYNAKLQFFLQGNTFEKQTDVALWKEIAQRGHAIDNHTYSHLAPLGQKTTQEIEQEITQTKNLIEKHLNMENIGLRTPWGYTNGLLRFDELSVESTPQEVQLAILNSGMKWVSSRISSSEGGQRVTDERSIEMIAERQPLYYDSGLLEIPFCIFQDREYFDSDCGGDPLRPLEEWIDYLKKAVDFAYENNLYLSVTVHPSTSFKHDPKGKYLKEIYEHCKKKPDIVLCTTRDIYRWVSNEKT